MEDRSSSASLSDSRAAAGRSASPSTPALRPVRRELASSMSTSRYPSTTIASLHDDEIPLKLAQDCCHCGCPERDNLNVQKRKLVLHEVHRLKATGFLGDSGVDSPRTCDILNACRVANKRFFRYKLYCLLGRARLCRLPSSWDDRFPRG